MLNCGKSRATQIIKPMLDRSNRCLMFCILLLLMTASTGTCVKKPSLSTYSEDLAIHRKNFQINQQPAAYPSKKKRKKETTCLIPLYTITDQLDYLLEQKKLANQQITHIQGYTIQVYVGSSREAAFKARHKLYIHYPAIQPEIQCDLPNYTVRLGNFLDQLEAYTVYTVIKKYMPQAMIRSIHLANTPHILQTSLQSN